MENLPIFEAKLNKGDGIYLISIVESPAIERDFVAFNEEEKTVHYFNEEQQIIVSPVMIPDKLIIRHDEKFGFFYTKFSKDVIKEIRYQYSKDNNFNKSNINHKEDANGIIMLESWIKESEDDKSNMYGFNDLPIGTWFAMYKVENQEVWQKIKEGKLNGLSIEGYITFDVEEYFKKKNQTMSTQKSESTKNKLLKIFNKKVTNKFENIFGYKFKFINLSEEGKILFDSFREMNLNVDDEGMVRSLALQLDSILEIQNKSMISAEDYKQAKVLVDDFKDLMNELSQRWSLTLDSSFIDKNFEQIDIKYKETKQKIENEIIKYFSSCGITEEQFKIDFANAELIPYAEGDILPKDNKQGRTFYKYTGPSPQRDFCKQLMGLNRLYTYEEIKRANTLSVNEGFGPEGASTYDIWFYKGGPNCKHRWTKIYATLNKQENKGPARGKAGTPMYDQPNRGYLNASKEEEFVILPKAGETKDEYISRCIAIEVNNGYSTDQASAICYDKWKNK